MTTAGDLDRRITLQRSSATYNDFNEPVLTWSDLATVWARRRDASDGEKEAAGQVGSMLMSRFVVRSSTTTRGLKPTDRVSYDGSVWNIKGIKETEQGRNQFIEITAVRDAD